jgi:antitoxin HicB
MNIRGYQVDVEPLSDRLGGGVVAYVRALKGCLADGRTEEEALENLQDAIHCWLETARCQGRPIPPPITASPRRVASRRDQAAAKRTAADARAGAELLEAQ